MSGLHVIPRLLCRRALCSNVRDSHCIHGSFSISTHHGLKLEQKLSVAKLAGVAMAEQSAVPWSTNAGPNALWVRHMAGHSHWHNIRHTKGAADAAKASFVQKMVKQMQIVAKEGGPDPKTNKKLADLAYSMEKQSIPKATIQRTLKRLADSSGAQTVYVEVRGPCGAVMVVELFSAQQKKARDDLLGLLKKTVGRAADNPSWQHLFDQQGVVTVPVTSDMDKSNTDQYVEIAIEAGAEDVILTEEEGEALLKFHCSPQQLRSVAKEIEEAYDLKVSSQEVDLVPHMFVTLENPADIEACQKIIARIGEHEDFVRVFDNISVPED